MQFRDRDYYRASLERMRQAHTLSMKGEAYALSMYFLRSSREFRAAMNEIVILWHNNLRFASEARLKAHLTALDRVQGIKGDPLKKNASDLIDAAQLIVNKRIVLWDSQTKS